MTNEEVDDSEFFQQDFTTASDWELFTARIEELFHEWRLPYAGIGKQLEKNQLVKCEWSVSRESIHFADVELKVERYKALLEPPTTDHDHHHHKKEDSGTCQAFNDILSCENDFCVVEEKSNASDSVHPLALWYGLREFVVIYPGKKSITNESQIRLLMSSVLISVVESGCDVPVFVQVLDKLQNVYLGVCEYGSIRLSFDIVHLATTPPPCRYLSGLLDMFKGKIGVQYSDPVTVSVRLTYRLSKFYSSNYLVERVIPFSGLEDYVEPDQRHVMPFGVAVDPVSEIILHCIWPQVAENVVIDSQTYSDFDPVLAPVWSIKCRFNDNAVCYMSESIQEYLQMSESKRALSEFISNLAMGTTHNLDASNPLNRLTESKIPTISSVIPTVMKRDRSENNLRLDGPLNEEQLREMLYYMFPDAQPESIYEYILPENQAYDPLKIKSAVPDSLVHRLSTILAICNSYYGGIRAFAQLWAEFSQEMRYRVERCIQIPGISNGFPDSRTCLLHQKLQMLNLCMERRRIREGGLPFAMSQSGAKSSKDEDDENSEVERDYSDEEFFDCSDEDVEEEAKKARHAPWNQPVGRLSRLGKMLLVDSDEPLYIPITQEPVPKTEDQLEDDAEVMLKLGPGNELCAQMMSASLLSDMESFKAANPAGKLEDFIRWYSPRDWIEEESDERDPFGRKGNLSSRMLIPGNTWQTVWDTARPVPARRQRRLFDDTKEAEKVLHFLESRTIGQIIKLTISSLFHTSIMKIHEEGKSFADFIPNFNENIEKITSLCCKLSRESWTQNAPTAWGNSQKKYEHLLTDITYLENVVIQARSLRRKLFSANDLGESDKNLLMSLLDNFERELPGGANNDISQRILNIFSEAKRAQNEQLIEGEQKVEVLALPDPIEKQFVLRVSGKTVSKSAGSPQFMRAILNPYEFRLCGAFSQNTTFY